MDDSGRDQPATFDMEEFDKRAALVNDSIFDASSPWPYNAFVQPTWGLYATGYKKAADLLVETAVRWAPSAGAPGASFSAPPQWGKYIIVYTENQGPCPLTRMSKDARSCAASSNRRSR